MIDVWLWLVIGSSKMLIWFLWMSNDFIFSDWQMLLLSYSVILPCSDWQVLLLFYSVILFCYSALLFSRRSEFGWNWCKLPSWSISAAIIIVAILIWKAYEGCFQILCYQGCYHCDINLKSTCTAHISHNRHNRRWCTFFKPAYFFPIENAKGTAFSQI